MSTDRSRHAGSGTYRISPEIELFQPRMRPRTPAVRQHVTELGDRLDLLAATYLGDPHLYWRLADTNPSTPPERLAEPGSTVDIPGPAT